MSLTPLKRLRRKTNQQLMPKETNTTKRRPFKKLNDQETKRCFLPASKASSYYSLNSLGHLRLLAVITCGLHFWETADRLKTTAVKVSSGKVFSIVSPGMGLFFFLVFGQRQSLWTLFILQTLQSQPICSLAGMPSSSAANLKECKSTYGGDI